MSIPDPILRLKVMQELQTGELEIAPVFPYPANWSKIGRNAWNMIIGKKYRKKYFLYLKNKTIQVTVPEKYLRDFVYATMNIQLKYSQKEN